MSSRKRQSNLFGPAVELPSGLTYLPSVLPEEDCQALVSRFEALPFKPFAFQGYFANRRIVSFGWRYDYAGRALQQADDLPEFLQPLRARAAALASLTPEALEQVLVTEYAAGAGIGWHRDKPMFENVIAFSFLSPCVLRFRIRSGKGWKRSSLAVESGSAYFLRGAARREWEHSIPPVSALRYSVTFRDFAPLKRPG
jgi:alkylated DNA repair dioxygenase AlkB